MKPHFFRTPADFRTWLSDHHESQTELLVGFYKVGSGKPSITWPESVDQALCFGWIDGVRRRIDEESYSIRFTPRKPTSIWSAVNIKKMADLEQAGLLHPAGIAAFAKRTDKKSNVYSYEIPAAELTPTFEKQFKANKKAWDFFQAQPPSYRKAALHLVMGAKQEKTRQSRFDALVADSENGLRIKQLRR